MKRLIQCSRHTAFECFGEVSRRLLVLQREGGGAGPGFGETSGAEPSDAGHVAARRIRVAGVAAVSGRRRGKVESGVKHVAALVVERPLHRRRGPDPTGLRNGAH